VSRQPRPIRASRRFQEVEHPQLAEKIDYGEIVRRHIDRCLQSATDDIMFASHVRALEALIPETEVTDDYLQELEESVQEVEISTPITNCGVPIDPNIIAANKQVVQDIDWVKRFNAAINLFTELGLTWRRVETTAF